MTEQFPFLKRKLKGYGVRGERRRFRVILQFNPSDVRRFKTKRLCRNGEKRLGRTNSNYPKVGGSGGSPFGPTG